MRTGGKIGKNFYIGENFQLYSSNLHCTHTLMLLLLVDNVEFVVDNVVLEMSPELVSVVIFHITPVVVVELRGGGVLGEASMI